jgi:hypothetical protein
MDWFRYFKVLESNVEVPTFTTLLHITRVCGSQWRISELRGVSSRCSISSDATNSNHELPILSVNIHLLPISLHSLRDLLRLKSRPRWLTHDARHSLFRAHIVVPAVALITTFASLLKCLGSSSTLSRISRWHVETRQDRDQSPSGVGSLLTTRHQVEPTVEEECRGRARPQKESVPEASGENKRRQEMERTQRTGGLQTT